MVISVDIILRWPKCLSFIFGGLFLLRFAHVSEDHVTMMHYA